METQVVRRWMDLPSSQGIIREVTSELKGINRARLSVDRPKKSSEEEEEAVRNES